MMRNSNQIESKFENSDSEDSDLESSLSDRPDSPVCNNSECMSCVIKKNSSYFNPPKTSIPTIPVIKSTTFTNKIRSDGTLCIRCRSASCLNFECTKIGKTIENTFEEFLCSKYVNRNESSSVKMSKLTEYYKYWCLFHDKEPIKCHPCHVLPSLSKYNFPIKTRKNKNKSAKFVYDIVLTK